MSKEESRILLAKCEDAVDLYTLESILEDNDMTEGEALYLLVKHGHLRLPERNMLNFEED